MITIDQLTEIGKFNAPHGIHGEIAATIDFDVDLAALHCIVVEMDGIFVPFFINTLRPRNHASLLLTIDGITDEKQASELTNKLIYALSEEFPEDEEEIIDDDGFFAADLIGFDVKDVDEKLAGKIVDIDDSTENVLFIVDSDDDKRILIPVADEYIEAIDAANRLLTVNLPDGFLDI